MIGRKLAHYEIVEKLCEGGMGETGTWTNYLFSSGKGLADVEVLEYPAGFAPKPGIHGCPVSPPSSA
ncbi:MAG: hypothetical protein ACKV22_06095 [Bryobacteraceae bacterium]